MRFWAVVKSKYDEHNIYTGVLASDVLSAATTINFGSPVVPGMYATLVAAGQREVVLIGSLVSGTTYNVTRDYLSAYSTDPAWSAGDFYFYSSSHENRFPMVHDSIDVTDSLRFSTSVAGGFASCSFVVSGFPGEIYRKTSSYLGAHVDVYDEIHRKVWEGYVSNVNVTNEGYGLDVEMVGYYTKANDVFFDMIYTFPEPTTNLIKNPSFESTNVTDGGWYVAVSAFMATMTKVADATAPFGSNCCKLIQPASGTTDYVVGVNTTGLTEDTKYTFSFYLKSGGIRQVPYVQFADGANNKLGFDQQITGMRTDIWQRYVYQVDLPAGQTTLKCFFVVPNRAENQPVSYVLIDGVQLEQKAYATPYCDGSLGTTYSWSGTAHNSTSSRAGVPVYQNDVLEDIIEFIPSWKKTYAFVQDADYDIGIADFTDKKAKDAIEYVLSYGRNVAETGDASPIFLALWNDRVPYVITQHRRHFNFNEIDWYINSSSAYGGQQNFSTTMDGVYNKVYSVYSTVSGGPTKTEPSEDPMSQERFGVREGFLQNGDYPFTQTQAYFMQDAALERYKNPRPSQSFTLTGLVTHKSGKQTGLWRVRAGDVIRITESFGKTLDLFSQHRTDLAPVFFILRTEYDATTDSLKIDVGSGDSSFEILMGRLGISGGLA